MISARLTLLLVLLIAPPTTGVTDGSVQIYLQPFPAEAAKLTFAISSVSAVGANGAEYPLTVALKTANAIEANRQRLLFGGRLPTGRYSGFLVRVARATLKVQNRDVPLTFSDAPARIEYSFAVSPQQTPLLWLALRYQDSVRQDSEFAPAFSVMTPSRPVSDHLGFVTNAASNTVTVFDKSLDLAVAVIDTCAGPSGLALDQRRRRLYVACAKDDEVQSIDGVTGELIQRVRLSPGDQPRELGLTSDGATLISVNPGSNSITFIDAESLTRQDRVNVGSGPTSVVIESTGKRAFVFNTLSSSLSVIDLASRAVTATLATDASPLRGQFNSTGKRLYVIHDRSPYMTVIDPQQLNVVTRARLNVGVAAIAVDPVRGLVCVGGGNSAAVDWYDPNALLPLYSMRTRPGVAFMAIDPQDNRLYMVNPTTRSVMVGGLADRRLAAEIDVGDGAYAVAVMGVK